MYGYECVCVDVCVCVVDIWPSHIQLLVSVVQRIVLPNTYRQFVYMYSVHVYRCTSRILLCWVITFDTYMYMYTNH